MTIYKPKNGVDRKLGTKLEKSPGVVLVGDDATVGLENVWTLFVYVRPLCQSLRRRSLLRRTGLQL